MIDFYNVTKKFPDGTAALSDVDLKIADGEFVFIIGPSGAGKTTLLRLVTRDLVPSSGKIVVDDQNLSKISDAALPEFRRKIGTVFQNYKLLSDQTVFENVAIALEILGKTDAEIAQQVKETLEKVDLAGKENYFPVQLSGGELQRTSIARAIISAPQIILADEPTADLDPATEWEIISLLDQINKAGKTIIMATHKADIVNSLIKRVVQIKNGKIVKDQKQGKYEHS